jgi:hypothetical protein
LEEIVDFNLLIGSSGVRQGYKQNLNQGDFYTQIRISFENANNGFLNTLSQTLSQTGDLLGCVVQNIRFKR